MHWKRNRNLPNIRLVIQSVCWLLKCWKLKNKKKTFLSNTKPLKKLRSNWVIVVVNESNFTRYYFTLMINYQLNTFCYSLYNKPTKNACAASMNYIWYPFNDYFRWYLMKHTFKIYTSVILNPLYNILVSKETLPLFVYL